MYIDEHNYSAWFKLPCPNTGIFKFMHIWKTWDYFSFFGCFMKRNLDFEWNFLREGGWHHSKRGRIWKLPSVILNFIGAWILCNVVSFFIKSIRVRLVSCMPWVKAESLRILTNLRREALLSQLPCKNFSFPLNLESIEVLDELAAELIIFPFDL